MGKIKLNKARVDQVTASLKTKVQTEVLEESSVSGKKMLNALELSCGDFADSLRAEIEKEMGIMEETGQLLTGLLDYIKKAAEDFENVDFTYQNKKITE